MRVVAQVAQQSTHRGPVLLHHVCVVVTCSPATAELVGRAWSGRALGVQNTMQNVAAFATAPLVGALAGSFGFPWAAR
ncbi:MAG: hypothetical protein ACYDC9_01015 [Dermatophilaceae bacterium]